MFERIAILGAGTMGTGLARLFAGSGMKVALYDPHREALDRARAAIALGAGGPADQHAGEDGGPAPVDEVLRLTRDLEEAIHEADFVLEAGPEQLEVKRGLYSAIASFLAPDALVASNTSSLPLESLAEGQAFGDRFVIAHFFNPADLVPLVELVKRPDTRSDLVDRLVKTLTHCGKAPVVLKKDCPGFIANRLQAAVLREACHLLQNGVADAEQIDRAMKEGPGLRWALGGPFEITDFGGLDIWERVADNLFPTLDNGLTAPEPIRDNVRNGKLGLKSGGGFYDYGDGDRRAAAARERDRKLALMIRVKKEMETR